jgi:hypothetical protein
MFAICLGLLWGLSATVAGATTVSERSLRDLAIESPSIVHGTVVSTSSRWTENQSLIVTDVVIEVSDTLKGNTTGRIVVTQPGGRVGKLRVDVAGATAFRPGEETVLFLKPSGDGTAIVTGLFQGRFGVVPDARGRRVVQGLSGDQLGTLQRASARTGRPLSTVPGRPVELDEFLGGMRSLLQDIQSEGGR